MESVKRHSFFRLCSSVIFLLWDYSVAADCPADGHTWVPFENSCYYFVHGQDDIAKSYTIEDAKHICKEYGLLSINTIEENNFIVKYSSFVWKDQINVWLGMFYDSDSDSLKWFDKTDVVLNNWDNSSTDLALIDVCAALHTSSGKWVKVSCEDDPEHGVVCESTQSNSKDNRPLFSALVILSVLIIIGISAVVWFLHQKNYFSSTSFTSFEYHPPFRSPSGDETSLVEAEEKEYTA
nr:PREDICTED: CD302 antigen-like isoform X1 [Lepisosteus oculatus]